MPDVKDLDLMVCEEEVAINPAALAAIEEGLRDLEAGRTHSTEEVRKLVRQWSTGTPARRER